MLLLPRPLALLVLVVIVSAGSRTVFAQDDSGHVESNGDSSVEVKYVNEKKAGVDDVQTPENVDNKLVGKAAESEAISGNLKSHVDQVELVESVENVPTTINRKDTDVEDVPDISERNPFDDKTRSGNLDAFYGK
jgi:hypothetical protein